MAVCGNCGAKLAHFAKVCFRCGGAPVPVKLDRRALADAARKELARLPPSKAVRDELLRDGEKRYSEKQYDAAFVSFELLVAMSPRLAQAWLGKGASLLGLDRVEEGIACLVRAVELAPTDEPMLRVVAKLTGREGVELPPSIAFAPPPAPVAVCEREEAAMRWQTRHGKIWKRPPRWLVAPTMSDSPRDDETASESDEVDAGAWSFDPTSPPIAKLLETADVVAKEGRYDEALGEIGAVLAHRIDASGAVERDARYRARVTLAHLSMRALRGPPEENLQAELRAIAAIAERIDPAAAVVAYALAGDEEARVGVLATTDAHVELHAELEALRAHASERDRASSEITRALELERCGSRLAALDLARRSSSPIVAELGMTILALLVRGPLVDLEIDGARDRYVLGDVVTIGRSGASILVGSPDVSRIHLRLSRIEAEAFVEDLDTQNGTFVGNARLAAPLPVGAGIRLDLARVVPCSIRSANAALSSPLLVDIAGEIVVVPLGPFALGGASIEGTSSRGACAIARPSERGATLHLDGVELASPIDLCFGDRIRGSGEILVLPPRARVAALRPGDERLGWVERRT